MAIGHWFKNFTKWYFNPDAEGGGGGSSDFSTVTVTFHMTNAGDEMVASFDVVLVDGYSMSKGADVYDTEEQYEVVLYKGSSAISPRGNTVIKSVSGDAELSLGTAYVHGDCTVVCEGEYIG